MGQIDVAGPGTEIAFIMCEQLTIDSDSEVRQRVTERREISDTEYSD